MHKGALTQSIYAGVFHIACRFESTYVGPCMSIETSAITKKCGNAFVNRIWQLGLKQENLLKFDKIWTKIGLLKV